MTAGKRKHRLSRLLANIAGWLGGRSQPRATGLGSAAMARQLAMTTLNAAGHYGHGAAANLSNVEFTAVPNLLIVPLPAGLGLPNDALAAVIRDEFDSEIEAEAFEADADAAHGADAIIARLAAALDWAPAPAAGTAAAVIAPALDAHSEVEAEADIAAASTRQPRAAGRDPLILSRQLHGVARLNKPVSREAEIMSRRRSQTRSTGAQQPAKARDGNRSRTGIRTRRVDLSGGSSRPARWPTAQAWILSRSARR